jgi:hypothetical protein
MLKFVILFRLVQFKEFITHQRVAIFIVGVATFTASLLVAHFAGFSTLWGELFIDLAASSVTIVFTALIIDYLRIREQSSKTKNAAGLAEDEIKATCFRIKWRLARLFGLERRNSGRDNISNRQEAQDYLNRVTNEVDSYLSQHSFVKDKTAVNEKTFPQYLERLQSAQNELEQVLVLYEYALPYSLRERVLSLRSELQVSERVLGFIDASESLSKANLSLIRVTAQSVYGAVEEVLEHDSRTALGVPIHAKDIKLQ